MARPMRPMDHKDNIVLGAGYVYFDIFDDNGNPTGERYLGQTPTLSISASSEVLEHFTSDGPIAQVDASVATQVTRTGSLTIDDISPENLRLFIVGEIDEINESAVSSPITQVFPTATRGLYYQLGDTDGPGDFNIDDIDSIESDGTALVEGTDYEIDKGSGRIYLKPESIAVTDGEELEVEYTLLARERRVIKTSDQVRLRGALRFTSDNSHGENINIYIPDCGISPDGELNFKSRTDWQQMAFSLQVSGQVFLYETVEAG